MRRDGRVVDDAGESGSSSDPSVPTDGTQPEDDYDEPTPPTQTRKADSAAENHRSVVRDDNDSDRDDDGALEPSGASRRPYTAATTSSARSQASASFRKKKAPTKRGATAESAAHQRPRSAGLNEWGDFDADRLLQDDVVFTANSMLDDAKRALSDTNRPATGAAASKPLARVRSRRNRHTAPVTTTVVNSNPAEDFPSMPPWTTDSARFKASREQPRPATHVLRQRPLAVVDFDSAQQLQRSKTPTRSSRPTALRGRIHPPTGGGPPPTPPSLQPNHLPQLTPTRLSPSDSLAPASLFGPSIPDTPETRAVVFERFRALWGLMSSRSSSASAALGSPLTSTSAAADSKSPFECSMALMKVCKSVGIARSSHSSSPAAVAVWSSRDRNVVDFQSFCSDVVRLAIAPILHHFHADASVDEFVAAVDRILDNVVTCTSSTEMEAPRLKELVEIRSLFPRWRVGASPLGTLDDGFEAAPSAFPDAPREGATPRRRLTAHTTVSSRRERTLELQLPTREAQATHDANIRRKVQLHKSWQTRSVQLATATAAAASQAVRERAFVVGTPSTASCSPLRTNAACSALARPSAADGHVPPARFGCDPHVLAAASEPATDDAPLTVVDSYDDVLVCGACTATDAALWCASCFQVFCVVCWQQQHRLRVDVAAVPSFASAHALLVPATKPLIQTKKKQTSSEASTSPPFAMIYLPTKPLAVGKLAKGATCKPSGCDECATGAANGASGQLFPAVASHALLPPLPSAPHTKLKKRAVRAASNEQLGESTSNLVKALMLGAAPPTRVRKAQPLPPSHAPLGRREKLRAAAVLLDCAQLAQSDGRWC